MILLFLSKHFITNIPKIKIMKTLTALLTSLAISTTSCGGWLVQRLPENIPPDTIPASVKEYTHYVEEHHFHYAPADHPSLCAAYSGQYLEKEKVGVCDEFAMNALLHLLDQNDIPDLFLVSYHGLRDTKSKDCKGEMTNEMGHAFVAYQTTTKKWRSLSDGQDEQIEENTLEQLITTATKLYHFTTIQRISAVPRNILQEKETREILLYAPPLEDISFYLGFLYNRYRIPIQQQQH